MGPATRGQDKIIAQLMISGGIVFVAAILVGTAMGWMGLGGSGVQNAIAIWVSGFAIGSALFLTGLGMGLARAKGIGGPKSEVLINDTKIVAIMALNPNMDPIWNEDTYAPDEIKRYVHLRYPDGRVVELQIDPRMLDGIGEGMKGNAVIAGDWMVGFQPTGI